MRNLANSVYMQEPHVKSGCGGLRDYQNLLWMAAFKEGALTTNHLVGRDWLSAGDQSRIEAPTISCCGCGPICTTRVGARAMSCI